MNSARTIDLFDRGSEIPVPATGAWEQSYGRPSETSWTMSRFAKSAGLLFYLITSSLTTMPDPWIIEKRRRDAVVTISIYKEIIGRPISRIEALRMARQILEQAERERLAFCEFEATRGIQWED